MKKLLTLVLATAMVIMLSIPAMAIVNYTAHEAIVGIEIDGVRDEAYGSDNDCMVIAAPLGLPEGKYTTSGMATGKAWVAWDNEALYYYMEVYDETPNHECDGKNDNVEIYIDWNAGRGGELTEEAEDGTMGYEPGQPEGYPAWQIFIPAAENQDGFQDFEGCILENTEDQQSWTGFIWSPTAAGIFMDVCEWATGPIDDNWRRGYFIEIRIPAPAGSEDRETGSTVDVKLVKGKEIPVDFQIGDNINGVDQDSADARVYLVKDDKYNDRQWACPFTYGGLMKLGDAYVPGANTGDNNNNGGDDNGDTNTGDNNNGDTNTGGDDNGDDALGGDDTDTGDDNNGGDDQDTATAAPTTTKRPSANTGDGSMTVFVIFAIAAVGALVITRRVSKNRA